MIENANLSEEQATVIKLACQEQIESLNRLLLYPGRVSSQLMLEKGINVTEDFVEDRIKEQIDLWQEIQNDPQKLMKLDEMNINTIQYIISDFFDNNDGDPVINSLWAKFIFRNDFKKQIPTIN